MDSSNGVAELLENNNTLVGSRLSVTSAPDLTVSEVGGPTSFSSASPLTLTAKVCNQGRAAASSQVELYLSEDTTLTTADTLVGSAPINNLEPGRCVPVSVSGPVGVSSGQWYVGGWVDRANAVTEALEDNNTRIGSRISAGSKPDLVVTAVSGPPSATYAESIAVTATVCNQGTTPSLDSSLSFYLSLDASISAADTLLSIVSVPGLQAGECAPLDASGSVNVTDGSWFLGAQVDSNNAVSELLENNNTRAGDMMGVGAAADLIVTGITNPSSWGIGYPFEASVTVCNQGTRSPLAASRVGLYASIDASVTASDPFLGEANVPLLLVGQCSQIPLSISAQLPKGLWYLGAIADRTHTVPELQENNNTLSGNTFLLEAGPDYSVSLKAPTSLLAGQPFTATVTVCNQGSLGIPVAKLYLSSDATITTADLELGAVDMFMLFSLACKDLQVTSTGLPEGTWYLGAIADEGFPQPDFMDALQENNAASMEVRVGAGPDLVLSRLTGPASVSAGQGFSATATVCNQGTGASAATSLVLQFSRDSLITAADVSDTSAAVPALQPNDCADISIPTAHASAPEGLWTLGARIDPDGTVAELREDNNAGPGGLMAIGTKADLLVSRLSAPTSASPGQPFEVSLTVCNQGTAPSMTTQVALLFSTDATLTHRDSLAGSAAVLPLEPGQCRDVSVQANASTGSGAWYFGALADSARNVSELRESDNAHLMGRFTIGAGPDLVVTKLDVQRDVSRGGDFTASVTVCNQGSESSGTSQFRIFAFEGARPTDSDVAGGNSLEPLEPGQCRDAMLDYLWVRGEGPRKLGADVALDPSSAPQELRTDNNTLIEGTLFLDDGQDLVVTAITTPPSVEPGQAFPVTATVCNQGTQPSPGATLTLRYSADALFTQYDLLAGSANVGSIPAGECFSVGMQPTAPASGLWRPGAIVSSQGGVELSEDNNTFLGAPLTVGQAPDLTVTKLHAPETSSRFTQVPVDVTVCNQGTEPSDSTVVELLFSTDTVLGMADVPAGSAALPSLPAGECATFRTKASINVDAGLWYFGARVLQSGLELRPDNNSRVVETVVGDGKDLVVTHVSASLDPWMGATASVTVCNQGSQPSIGGNVDVFYSDIHLVPSSYPLAAAGLPDLAPGECTTQYVYGGYPGEGPFVLGARVSGTCCGPELREDNDTRIDGGQWYSGYRENLVIQSIQAPASALTGESLTAEVTVCTVFPTASPYGSDVTLDLFLSQDGALDAGDLPVSSTVLSLTQSTQCHTASMPFSAPQGVWTLLGRVKPGHGVDLREDDNITAGNRLAIGSAADLTVTRVSSRAAVLAGSSFPVEATVCNQGTAASGPVALGFFLSFDGHATQGELSAGTAQVPALVPGECTEVVGSASAPSDSAIPYRVVALVDPSHSLPELREDNNDLGGNWLGVGPGPELLITSVTGPAAVVPGGTFQALVTVCNEGSQPVSGAALAVVISADSTITATDTRLGTGTLSVGSGACTTVTVAAISESLETSWTLGAIVDPADTVPELVELNNTRAGGTLQVGYRSDFVITHVTGPAQVASGAGFSADVEVCNQGTMAAYPEVAIVFSTDDTFTLDDVMAGSEFFYDIIEPGQCTTVTVQGVAYPGPGHYQLGALVDWNQLEPEFNESNNTGSGGGVDVL